VTVIEQDEEPLDPELAQMARDYREPPDTPRELMWRRIELARRTRRMPTPWRRWAVPAGIAAVLALGVAIGRSTAPHTGSAAAPAAGGPAVATAAPAPVQPGADASTVAYRIAATQYLGQSEAFLTLFRASVQQGRPDPLAEPTARQLLATNRLLLDSPAGGDPRMRALLQDLELVLAQIAQLSPSHGQEELRYITDDMERGAVLSRIRTAVPAGPATLNQGAL
jgi:hypothetical protein